MIGSNNDLNECLSNKNKGWNFLYETIVKASSNASMKYENTLINKDLPDLQSFNRFSFTLSSTGNIPREELEVAQKLLKICNLRDEYIKNFTDIDTSVIEDAVVSECYKKKHPDQFESAEPIYNPYNVTILKKCNAFINFVDGIFFVHWDPDIDQGPISKEECNESNKLKGHKSIKSTEEYLSSIQLIMVAVQDPACKSFCYQRLKYLEQKFDFHIMFNGSLELGEAKNIKHRDFYNIRKVDTHVHHSACMQQKVLLRFIREKYKTEPNTIVYVNEEGEKMTLKQIFDKELKSSAYEATVDSLAVNALGNCFHRFDLFNQKYNPFGQKLLRDIFLKTDNYIEGRYLAEITKQEIEKLENSKYQHVEWRISIYGKNKNEWLKLAKWVLVNKLSSIRVRWVIQVPRLYHIYKKMKLINTFGDFLRNVFEPCFEAVKNPEENKEIFTFLHQVVAWDSVDDESVVSKYTVKGGELPTPDNYTSDNNPPYSYYAYYMYANIRTLNEFMVLRKLRPLAFRPHCGETGNISHLATMFLLADKINHGINLRKSPVLLYLYYLKQIGLAISPLSNNALFLQIEKNPFKNFFKIGLNVSLSTDDPLMFHFTDEPLLEEYSICAHMWKLSTVDLSEIARNSVIQSGFEPAFKKHWLGVHLDESLNFHNNPEKTNIANTRMIYRKNTLEEENKNIKRLVNFTEKLL
ncbi:AMP deaminase, putative [Plasmodium gallinaceum]|uniref:AMP deaminase n=1 Tax=Plasmodium gallinaceum TaxID=5849 RepID=A0A1J1GVE9_PLAGA|nr:AMP deaminase, putative [Plasmodium gallinaceum]CRG95019.1 AMP deaminase, putative [Plasmodium gallinaceum]